MVFGKTSSTYDILPQMLPCDDGRVDSGCICKLCPRASLTPKKQPQFPAMQIRRHKACSHL